VPSVQADLDHAATTPPRPEVLEVLERWVGAANASARHLPGQAARRAVEHAREQAAAALGCGPHDVVFTSGGTEADNLAVKGIVWAARARPAGRPVHLVTTAVEHAAVLEPARWLAARGDVELDVVAPEPDGGSRRRRARARARRLGRSPTDRARERHGREQRARRDQRRRDARCSAARARRRAPRRRGAVRRDARRVAGRAGRRTRSPSRRTRSAGRRVSGSPCCGVGSPSSRTSHGGGQDRGVRSGTFAVGLIAACGEALERAARSATRSRAARSRGSPTGSRPGSRRSTASGAAVPVDRCAAPRLARARDDRRGRRGGARARARRRGVAASAGSACSSGASTVARRRGLRARRAPLRLSLGWTSTEAEVDHAVAVLRELVPRLRDGGDVFGLARRSAGSCLMARVLVAMSGGVDSAVAAELLVAQGHDVTGVHLRLADVPDGEQVPGHGCCGLDDAQDARRTAQVLGIPFYVWDLTDVFAREVQAPFAAEYAVGTHSQPVRDLQRARQVRGAAGPCDRARLRRDRDRPSRAPRA
jgi:cysteine desulfurase